jgi:ABC-2 type transport system ATP-binding protein
MIEARGLTKRYGRTRALDGLDLTAQRGQVVAVLGPNGAGKTTFVRIVATLLAPDEGTLNVAGHDVRRDPGAVRRAIGLAGQFAAIEPAMTGRENLEMVARLFGLGRRDAKAAAASVLDQLGLAGDGDRLARTYSGGMRRRLDLGASLVGAPRLLLLDEPTTGLDPRSRIELWDAIRALVAGGTDVLLTTQYLDETTRRVSVGMDSGSDGLLTALRSLQDAGLPVDDVAMRQPNLNEVFLALTGHPTDTPDPGTAAAAA